MFEDRQKDCEEIFEKMIEVTEGRFINNVVTAACWLIGAHASRQNKDSLDDRFQEVFELIRITEKQYRIHCENNPCKHGGEENEAGD